MRTPKYIIERLQKDFPDHTFAIWTSKKEEVISMLKDEKTWELMVDGTKSKIRWTQEAESDLEIYHNLYIGAEIYTLIYNELKLYFNRK
jgi:hypothetical protein